MTFAVRLEPSGRCVRAAPGATLLDVVIEAGLPLARGCGAEALCARCGLRVLAGAEALSPETPAEREAKARNRIDPGLRLACCAVVQGDVEVTAAYW
jgi:adenylate cyclase